MPRNNKSVCGIDLACQDLGALEKTIFKMPGPVLGTLGVGRVWGDISSNGLSLPSSTKCDPGALNPATQLGTQPRPCSAEYQTLCTAGGTGHLPPTHNPTPAFSPSPSDTVYLLCTLLNSHTQHLFTLRDPWVLVLFHKMQECRPQSSSFLPRDLRPSPSL